MKELKNYAKLIYEKDLCAVKNLIKKLIYDDNIWVIGKVNRYFFTEEEKELFKTKRSRREFKKLFDEEFSDYLLYLWKNGYDFSKKTSYTFNKEILTLNFKDVKDIKEAS